ncbi:hypothetical protein [Butyrivibrio sp. NC2002]|uniref:hypothetical protein n=1 Tax=Butyrivibrio sp. NC2002 TaxID=1410610 RepID=UPI00055F76C3|nr:hypothetical protein [Butyrivibrio sp. NC2002]
MDNKEKTENNETTVVVDKNAEESHFRSQELLEKIYENSQKQLFYKKIEMLCLAVCVVAIIIAMIIMVPRVTKLADTLQDSAERIDTTIDKADKAMDDVSEMATSVKTIAHGIDEIVGENGESLTNTVEKLSNIDFDGLNNAIKDLQDAVGPLAKLMKRFN